MGSHNQDSSDDDVEESVAVDPGTAGKPTPTGKIPRILFGNATYLGGFAGADRKKKGNLIFDAEHVGIGGMHPRTLRYRSCFVQSIEVTSSQVAKSKVGASVVFGVLGGLAAKGTKNEAIIIVHGTSSDGYFQLEKINAATIFGKLAPWMRAWSVPSHDEFLRSAPQTVSAPSFDVGQVAQLAQLHASGALTDEEFAAAKARLLS